MRTIAAVLFVSVFLILELPFMGIMWLIGKWNKPASDLVQLRVVQWGFKVVLFIGGTRLIVKGRENIPQGEAVLYVGNHRSYWDVITTYSLCPGLTGYIAKDGINRVPILGMVMKRLYCLFLDRTDLKQNLQIVVQAAKYIKSGISICIFPEGTRNKDMEHPENLLPFKEGSFKIATKTKCKVIPMAISGSAECFEKQFPWVKKGTVTITYGKPIETAELEKAEQKHLGGDTRERIRQMIIEENR